MNSLSYVEVKNSLESVNQLYKLAGGLIFIVLKLITPSENLIHTKYTHSASRGLLLTVITFLGKRPLHCSTEVINTHLHP